LLSSIAGTSDAGRIEVRPSQEAIMNGHGDSPRDGSRWGTHGKTVVVASGRRRVCIRKSSSRKLRDLPELDLRTPSGRLLPF